MVDFSGIEKGKIKEGPQAQPAPSHKETSLADVEAVYGEAILSVQQIYQEAAQKKTLNSQVLITLVGGLVRLASTDDKIIFLTSKIYPQNYLMHHIVNVGIMAIKLGLYLKYPAEALINLGALALLHAINSPDYEGQEIGALERQDFLRDFTRNRGMDDKSLKEALGIIAVLDVYESLTHTRAYRQRFTPYEVLRAIISASEEVFDREIVKKAINFFSLYPLGTLVRLNSDEVAEVVEINQSFPLRPRVVIFMDREGNRLKERKTVDLAVHLNLYIKEPVQEELY